jgi:hypothetical protein
LVGEKTDLTSSRDKLIFIQDIRAAVMLIPRSGTLERITQISGWKPDGAQSLGRLDDP